MKSVYNVGDRRCMTCRKEFQIECRQCNSSYLREEELGTSLNSRDRALAKMFLSDARKSQVNFSILGECFGPIFGQIVSIRVKALSDTNLAIKGKGLLPASLPRSRFLDVMQCSPNALFFGGEGRGERCVTSKKRLRGRLTSGCHASLKKSLCLAF